MVSKLTFVEREPYEKGFAEVFADHIAPKLPEMEQGRLDGLNRTKLRIRAVVIPVVVILVAVATAAMYLSDLGWFWIFLIVFIGGCALVYWAHAPNRRHQDDLRDIVVGPVCQFFGDLEYSRDPGDCFNHARFVDLGVIDAYDSAETEDLFVGRYRDTRFKMIEGRFVRSGEASISRCSSSLVYALSSVFFGRGYSLCKDFQCKGTALESRSDLIGLI